MLEAVSLCVYPQGMVSMDCSALILLVPVSTSVLNYGPVQRGRGTYNVNIARAGAVWCTATAT